MNYTSISVLYRAVCLSAAVLVAGCATPDPDSVRADFDRGLAAYDHKDYAAAFHIWDGIKDADAAALRNVAVMLRTGQGVRKDTARAQALFAEAADAGLSSAAYNLGQMLLAGEAGPPDIPGGLMRLEQAAPGQPLAAIELGRIYRDGRLVRADPARARHFFGMAASAGNELAVQELKSLPAETAP